MDTLNAQIVGRMEVRVDDNYPEPENSRSFNRRLESDFGLIGGKPRYRVSWGQDPRNTLWQAGKYRLRYVYAVFREERLHGATILDTIKSKSRYIGFKQAENYIAKPGELILPDIQKIEKEIGDPFYWLEYYAGSHYFGTQDEWEAHRWFDVGDGHKIDLTGPFPKNGRYEPLLRLSVLTETGEDYRPINDNTYDWISSMLRGDKQKMEQALNEQRTRFDREVEAAFEDEDIIHEAENTKKHKYSLIVNSDGNPFPTEG
jgi:hypothetical protein